MINNFERRKVHDKLLDADDCILADNRRSISYSRLYPQFKYMTFNHSRWLVSSVGRTLYRYRKGHRFKSRTGLNFFQVFFSLLLLLVSITAKIAFIFTSLTGVGIYDFHIFIAVYSPLHGFIWNQHSDQLPVSGIAEVMGSIR